MKLRDYQQDAHDAIVKWIKRAYAPCLIEAATGAGKSHIIAALSKTVHDLSGGKRILCVAPSAELVIQNSEKYGATGNPFSLFSAAVGQKSLRHPVVFGTPMTIANKIEKFGEEFAMVVVDECHGITPTIKEIISSIRAKNNRLRVVGMTATPYRLGEGYIHAQWPDGVIVPAHERLETPYFEACVHRILARELIERGYLTSPVIGAIRAESYHTLDMTLNSRGQFDADDVDRAYHGQGRKTAAIIADIVAQARERQGVMIFAATVRHAQECMASLPPELSAIVTGDTPKAERKDIIDRFKAREIKYLVNVAVLTTGFDAPHVDVVAILRATESVGLLQQIIGRGLRLSDGKADCLILDYAENIERHCPDGDIFTPTIRAGKVSEGGMIEAECNLCQKMNLFRARPNPDGYEVDRQGFFCDLGGHRIEVDEGPLPAHFGRRCEGRDILGGEAVRCGYRWTFKACPHCDEENDIAARYCSSCKGEIVDPNEKLRIEFQAMKADPARRQTDLVTFFEKKPTISKNGNEMWRVDVTTPYRKFSYWVPRNPTWQRGRLEKAMFDALGGEPPRTITYEKETNGFYRVLSYNRQHDEAPV